VLDDSDLDPVGDGFTIEEVIVFVDTYPALPIAPFGIEIQLPYLFR